MTEVFSDKIGKAENKEGEIKELNAKRIVDGWIEFYSSDRPHTALNKRTQDAAYFTRADIRNMA